MKSIKYLLKIIHYYFYKISSIILSRVVWLIYKFPSPKGVFAYSPDNFEFKNKIIFAFWNKKLVHLGDQLFHQPIIEALQKHYDVYVCSDDPLKEYFKALGVKTVTLPELKQEKIEGGIFISKGDMAFDVYKNFPRNNSFIGIHYGKIEGEEKIVVSLAKNIINMMKLLKIKGVDGLLEKMNFQPEIPASILNTPEKQDDLRYFLNNKNKKFIIFNNYVASNFIDTKKREHLLDEIARNKKEQGYLIVHCGSAQDKAADNNYYDFIDIDLRGKLGIIDLFKLFSLENIKGIIGFDAFVMHIASLFKKDLYVVVRKESQKELFRKKFVPMYPGEDGIVKEYL